MLCSECGEEINNQPMYARIVTDETGEIVVETKCYHNPQCLFWLLEGIGAKELAKAEEQVGTKIFRGSN